jgi:hypothetical protein
MAATIARPRFQPSPPFHESHNAEAGPSRPSRSLVTDSHQSIHALSRLKIAVEYTTGTDITRGTGKNSGTKEEKLREVKPDDDDEEDLPLATLADIKGKKPIRPKKYPCVWEGCDKSFVKPAKLREHELSHTGEVSPSLPTHHPPKN